MSVRYRKCFSALQRAENSSIMRVAPLSSVPTLVSVLFSEPKIPQFQTAFRMRPSGWSFQCSSASRKFLNGNDRTQVLPELMFQCSSASRKFLNPGKSAATCSCSTCFSALQRAENSSIDVCSRRRCSWKVSVLFSEPKIPQFFTAYGYTGKRSRFSALQRAENSSMRNGIQRNGSGDDVSVLFSEPKIPQS